MNQEGKIHDQDYFWWQAKKIKTERAQ